MGSRRGRGHHRLQTAEQRAQAFVLIGLPIEVWDLIVGWCDIDDMQALARACAALRRCALARVDAACRATHASVDAFVALWERETSRGDRLFGALSCSRCGTRRRAIFVSPPPPSSSSPFFSFFACVFCGAAVSLGRRGPSMCVGFFIRSFTDLFSRRCWRSAPGAVQALGRTQATIAATMTTTKTTIIPRARTLQRCR